MPRGFTYLAGLFLVCTLTLYAQQDQQFVFHRLSTHDGLSSDFVNALIRDSRGFLWVATDEGLNRWDGHSFTVYKHNPNNPRSLSNDTVTSVFEDREGRLWIGTYNGTVNLFDPCTETAVRYSPERHRTEEEPLSIRQIHQDRQGRFWVCRWGGGLAAFDPGSGRFTPVLFDGDDAIGHPSQYVKALHELPDGTFLVSGWERAVYLFDPGTNKLTPLFPSTEMNVKQWKENEYILKTVHSINADTHGNLWFGSYLGVARLDPAMKTAAYFKNIPGDRTSLGMNNVWDVVEDGQGNIWCATYGNGLDMLNPRTDRFRHFRYDPVIPTSISSNVVKDLYVDEQGIIWIATAGGGISYLDDVERRYMLLDADRVGISPKGRGTKKPIQALYADEPGTLYLGTMDGYNRITTDGVTFVDRPFKSLYKEEAHYFNIFGFHRMSSGELLAYSYYRLHLLNEQTGRMRTYGNGRGDDNGKDFPLSINSVIEHHNDVLVGGADFSGLWSVDRKSGKWTSLSQPFGYAKLFQTRDGLMWVGTDSCFGLYEYDTRTVYPLTTISPTGRSVRDLYTDSRGRTWVITGSGLYRLDPSAMKITRPEMNAVMLHKDLYAMFEDRKGDLWISCTVGLYQFSRNLELINFYDKKNGIPVSTFEGPAAQDGDGMMYFASNDGIVVADPNRKMANTIAPPVIISGIKIFNQSIESDTSTYAMNLLRLTHNQDVVTFQFAALNFIHPSRNRYAYMLEGFDEDWVYAQNRREITYTNLDPGSYTFRVKAANNDGLWNEEGASLAVIVLPPWYLTWWAYLIYGVLAIAAIVVTDRMRKQSVRRKIETEARIREAHLEGLYSVERERVRIARDVHDLIGANLTRISLLGGIIGKKLRNQEDVTESVDEMGIAARETVQSFDEIVWAVDPQHDTLDGLIEYLIEHVETFLGAAGITCELHVPLDIPDRTIAAETRHNVYLVVAEALNNTAKYAEATKVAFHAGLNGGDECIVRLEDDGKGFSMDDVGEFSHGLANMRERMQNIRGSFRILSADGQGTNITITFPLRKPDA